MPVPAGSSPPPASPSGPLYYDPVLSRVRLSLTGLSNSFSDLFTAPATGGWGPSWTVDGAATSQFLVTGGVGIHRVNALNTRFRSRTAGLSLVDFDERVTVRLDTAPVGNYIRAEAHARIVDGNNYYALRMHVLVGGAIDLQLIRLVGGVETSLAAVSTGTFHTAGMSLHLRFQGAGSTLRGWVRRDDSAEPTLPLVTVLDSTHTVGDVGVASLFPPGNSNTLPYDVVFDGFSVVATVSVERSTDGVRWSTVRGGGALVPAAGEVHLDDYEFAPNVVNHYRVSSLFAGSITPDIGGVWLKSLSRPFLNRQVVVRDFSDVSRRARAGVFDVVGRSFPVAVTDVRGSRQWTLDVSTFTEQDRSDLDLLLAAGDILLVQVPPAAGRISAVPGGYVTVGDTREVTPPTSDLAMRVFSLPCTEVAAPGPDVVGAISSWQTVLNTYSTWGTLLAAHPTWGSVLELIGDPEDVIVS